MTYPYSQFREIFSIATDIPEAVLKKAFFEAEKLDFLPQIKPLTWNEIPSEYLDNQVVVGANTILCYYAYSRYIKTSTQQSTSTGVVIPTFNNSIVVPTDDRNTRSESERGKADIFMADLVCELQKVGLLHCANKGSARIWLIK